MVDIREKIALLYFLWLGFLTETTVKLWFDNLTKLKRLIQRQKYKLKKAQALLYRDKQIYVVLINEEIFQVKIN